MGMEGTTGSSGVGAKGDFQYRDHTDLYTVFDTSVSAIYPCVFVFLSICLGRLSFACSAYHHASWLFCPLHWQTICEAFCLS